MDRFVTRAPTWKTMNYSNVASSGYGRVSVGAKTVTIEKFHKVTGKKALAALQEKPIELQEGAIEKQQVAFSATTRGRRISIRDERLLKIFASQPDQPLLDPLASDSGCSSSSDSFRYSGSKHDRDENTPPVGTEKINLCKFFFFFVYIIYFIVKFYLK